MKTLTLKSSPGGAPAAPAQPSQQQEGIYVASRHRNPLETGEAVKRENWTWAGILAIVATILFAVLLALQYTDWTALKVA
ncbi:MAG: hypothetical protein IJ678_02320 [Kiritimatiellae bacterium]|nr:hypothetical protein [Kiritimatiellia bacterium]MBR1836114.1 hypothetical protein [Kiritimatiellia bacterium]